MLKLNDQYSEEFVITQEQVVQFAEVCGDKNPLHIDAEYAASTPFKSPIVHGMFSASIISKILGTKFPGEGTLYLGQNLEFKRPVYPGKKYLAICEILETVDGKHIATLSTQIKDVETGKLVLDGTAKVSHLDKLP